MAKVPGESGGRRKIGRDSGSPSTGDGRTAKKGKIKGSDVSFRTAGGSEVGKGGFVAKLIRRVAGGKHQG